jgi:regulator of cell morphogenesis and NO signaling
MSSAGQSFSHPQQIRSGFLGCSGNFGILRPFHLNCRAIPNLEQVTEVTAWRSAERHNRFRRMNRPMTNTVTLADLAATSLNAIRILEQHGLDYCCRGKQPLEQACAAKGLAPDQILREIEQDAGTSAADRDWQTAPLDELVTHIVETHHAYLKLDLPVLQARIEKVAAVHGARDPERLRRLAAVFTGLRHELELHLQKEEAILFPFIVQYGRAESRNQPVPPVPFGSIANPIAVMDREHTDAGDALQEIRELTEDYTPPAYACATVRALYEGLKTLEKDLHIHIHLENNILFPRASALEKR